MKAKTIYLAAVIALINQIGASATEFRAFERSAQIVGSELILTGRVMTAASEWTPDRSAIYTDADIAVDSVWKGLPEADHVSVRTLGGRVGNVRLEVEGAASFIPGEQVLVFLHRSNDVWTPWGMRYGKYTVVGGGVNALAVGNTPPSSPESHSAPQITVSLNALRTEVATTLSEEAK
jgi:hypothetical protein